MDGGLKQAKAALESGPDVPRDESTMLELCRLVAIDVDDAERCAQTVACTCPSCSMPAAEDETFALTCVEAQDSGEPWTKWLAQHARTGCSPCAWWDAALDAMGCVVGKGQGHAGSCTDVDGSSRQSRGLRGCERRQVSRPDESFGPSLARRHL